jgi:hypothetical protein
MTTMTNRTIEDTALVLRRLQALLAEKGLEGVRAEVIGRTLLLEGSVGSYEAKCRIEKAAQALVLRLDSSLRVIPGAFSDSTSRF